MQMLRKLIADLGQDVWTGPGGPASWTSERCPSALLSPVQPRQILEGTGMQDFSYSLFPRLLTWFPKPEWGMCWLFWDANGDFCSLWRNQEALAADGKDRAWDTGARETSLGDTWLAAPCLFFHLLKAAVRSQLSEWWEIIWKSNGVTQGERKKE